MPYPTIFTQRRGPATRNNTKEITGSNLLDKHPSLQFKHENYKTTIIGKLKLACRKYERPHWKNNTGFTLAMGGGFNNQLY